MDRPRIVIVGAGFGGLAAARELAGADADVTVVDRNNYHLFQPLLYQVATAGLSPADIAHPVRGILRRQANVRFRMALVRGADWDRRVLQLDEGEIPFDALIVAVGGTTNYFGNAELERNALGLKGIGDAIAIRDHVLTLFEAASHETDRLKRQALLTFVIAGGGPTGVECAGAISELVRLVLARDLPTMDVEDVRVVVVEGGSTILDGFPPKLRAKAIELLRGKKVEVRLNSHVAAFDGAKTVMKSGETFPTHTLIWAAGVRAAGLIQALGLKTARQGRAVVEPTLAVPGRKGVFVIGDAAWLEHEGAALPMVAPVAIQQGRLAARNALAELAGKPLGTFEYKDPGSLATIGRNAAVARLGRFEFAGWFAWVMWLVVHIIQLIGFRNRVLVLVNWAWDYFFYERAVRLILPKNRREA